MKYYIGIDGGATESKCVVTDSGLKIIYSTKGGPTNFLIRGTDEVCDNIYELVKSCIENISITKNDSVILSIGTTGAGRKTDVDKLHSALTAFLQTKGYAFENILIESDVRIALEGAFTGGPGMLLIAGTGSIILGKDMNGSIHRAGGFGRFIGDEGSGYSIGRKGLQAVSKYFDGRGEDTLLVHLLVEQYNINDSASLIDSVYNKNFDIPSVTMLVVGAANKRDSVCMQILDDESDELILHVECLMKKLVEENINLCLIGSLITNENYYSISFGEKLAEKYPLVKIKNPDYPPEVGAVILAMKDILIKKEMNKKNRH
ncbi:MAG: BadF/BadG/BcrA/BcrD ATPase family protein [bacterium]